MITLTVNSQEVHVPSDPQTPLLWVLRDTLALKGTKYCCGIGVCGVCTVHLDGVPVRSCVTPLAAAAGRNVTTIEGLAANPDHPVLRAWIEERVPQCGYCQPGQIMTAAALLAKHSQPSDTDIDDALSGVLCRCGTYLRIRRAVHRAAANLQESGNVSATV